MTFDIGSHLRLRLPAFVLALLFLSASSSAIGQWMPAAPSPQLPLGVNGMGATDSTLYFVARGEPQQIPNRSHSIYLTFDLDQLDTLGPATGARQFLRVGSRLYTARRPPGSSTQASVFSYGNTAQDNDMVGGSGFAFSRLGVTLPQDSTRGERQPMLAGAYGRIYGAADSALFQWAPTDTRWYGRSTDLPPHRNLALTSRRDTLFLNADLSDRGAVYSSIDSGKTWLLIGTIPYRPTDTCTDYSNTLLASLIIRDTVILGSCRCSDTAFRLNRRTGSSSYITAPRHWSDLGPVIAATSDRSDSLGGVWISHDDGLTWRPTEFGPAGRYGAAHLRSTAPVVRFGDRVVFGSLSLKVYDPVMGDSVMTGPLWSRPLAELLPQTGVSREEVAGRSAGEWSPNPVRELARLEIGSDAVVTLTAADGRPVVERALRIEERPNSRLIHLDATSLSSGVYVARIINGGGVEYRQVVVVR